MNRRQFGRASVAGLAGFAMPQGTADTPRTYRYVHLDVFTDRRLQGNQLFVFVQPSGLDADTMLMLTRESNLSECTFVFPPEQAGTDHRVRIFTRTAETPFAGHPTIGTAFALAHTGVLKPSMARTVFGLGVGPTNVDLEWKDGKLGFAWMTQLKPTFGKTVDDPTALAAAIGLDASTIHVLPPGQEVNCGSNFFVVPLATRKAVDAAVLDPPGSTHCSTRPAFSDAASTYARPSADRTMRPHIAGCWDRAASKIRRPDRRRDPRDAFSRNTASCRRSVRGRSCSSRGSWYGARAAFT